MRKTTAGIGAVLLGLAAAGGLRAENAGGVVRKEESLGAQARASVRKLHNGWSISPIGQGIQIGDLPLNMVVSPDGKRVVVLNSGFNEHALTVIDILSGAVVQRVPLKTSWFGLAWSPAGDRLYVSGGNLRAVKGASASAPMGVFAYDPASAAPLTRVETPVFAETRKALQAAGSTVDSAFPMPESAEPPLQAEDVFWAGAVCHPTLPLLYAASRTAGHVVVFDTNTGEVKFRVPAQVNPYDLVFSSDAKTLFVSNWASRSVGVIDATTHRVRRVIQVGANPNDMALAPDGRLFVACASDNSVTVINTRTEKVVGRIVTSLWERDPVGSTPNFVLVNDAGDTLYVANADNNNICVVDITPGADARVLGFIPTADYPTSLAWAPAANRLIVGTAKGIELGSNLWGPKIGDDGGGKVPATEGVAGSTKTLMKGYVHIFRPPASGGELKELTSQAYANAPYHEELLREARKPAEASVVPTTVGQGSAIKHVIYILKENRTYDQVLGDMAKGNGDARICLFGKDVTPNAHALADEYGLFDNYNVDAEVSVDGHSWSSAAWATDFNEKNWPADYGNRIARAPQTQAMRPPEGYLWDYCARAGITYRSYGEMTYLPTLVGHVAPDYKGWDTASGLDEQNADEFIKEFDEYEKNYDSADPAKRLPSYSMVCLPHDHTYGASPGKPTVKACVASNDLALGRMVERISHSRYWAETAIFVTEDDAQDGSDHVDCHRSILLAISPYSHRGKVDSTHYTTSSILRTIELLLGLPPMSQFDAAATPLHAALGAEADPTPYSARPTTVDLAEKNTVKTAGAKASMEMDFSQLDRAPMLELNEIIWRIVRGEDSEMPPPVRRFEIGGTTPKLEDEADGDGGDDQAAKALQGKTARAAAHKAADKDDDDK